MGAIHAVYLAFFQKMEVEKRQTVIREIKEPLFGDYSQEDSNPCSCSNNVVRISPKANRKCYSEKIVLHRVIGVKVNYNTKQYSTTILVVILMKHYVYFKCFKLVDFAQLTGNQVRRHYNLITTHTISRGGFFENKGGHYYEIT